MRQARLILQETVLGVLMVSACGNLATEADSQSATLKDVREQTQIVTGSPATLEIAAGSALGTAVEVPADALPEGTTLALDRVDDPAEFSQLTGANASGAMASASPAIALEAGDLDEALAPMTLAIPYTGDSASLWLLDATRTSDKLCALHLTRKKKIVVFRHGLLQLDTANKVVRLRSSSFGIYQLFFCPDEALDESVADASEEGLGAPPPGRDEEQFSSFGAATTLALSVGSEYVSAGETCLILGYEASSEATVIVGAASARGAAPSFAIEFDAAVIPDQADSFVALLWGVGCTLKAGERLGAGQTPDFERVVVFHLDKTELNAGVKGRLGHDIFALAPVTLKRDGMPMSVAGCLEASGGELTSSGPVGYAAINVDLGLASDTVATLWVPSDATQGGVEASLWLDTTCQNKPEGSTQSTDGDPPLRLLADASGAIGVATRLIKSETLQLDALAASVLGDSFCSDFYPSSYLDATSLERLDTQTITLGDTSRVGTVQPSAQVRLRRVAVSSRGTTPLVLPLAPGQRVLGELDILVSSLSGGVCVDSPELGPFLQNNRLLP